MPRPAVRARLSGLRPQSLRSRLTLGVVAVLALVLLLGGAYVAREADRTERQAVDDRLQRTAELLDKIAADIVTEGDDPLPGDEARRRDVEARRRDVEDARLDRVLRATRSSLVVTFGDARFYEQGVPIPGLGRTPLGFSTRRVDGRPLRVFTKVVAEDGLGGLTRLQATADLRQIASRQVALRRRLVAVGAAMLLLAGLGTALAAELVLRPVRRLRLHARGIEGESDLEGRVPAAGPTEIRQLAGSFNAMLQRLGHSADDRTRALDATRRFAADVGHELRTPLTSIQAALSTIRRHPDMAPGTRAMIVDDALTENRRLVLLLDGLQTLARGDANRVEQTDVDLASVVADATAAAAEAHPGTSFASRLPDHAVVVRGWEPGLRSLVDNLLRNAARHGRDGGHVAVGVRAGGGPAEAGAVLVVEDDGPGIAPEERRRVFEPFTRTGGTDAPGSGLGLAIVAQQGRLHDATVTIEDARTGGARFVVRFPAG